MGGLLALGADAPGALCMNELWASTPYKGYGGANGEADFNADGRADLSMYAYFYGDPSESGNREKYINGDGSYSIMYDSNPGDTPGPRIYSNIAWKASASGALTATDIDGDSVPDWIEYSSSGEIYNASASSWLRLRRSSDGVIVWDSGLLSGEIGSVSGADLLNGPASEIIYSFTPNSNTMTTQVRVLDGITKALLWSYSGISNYTSFDNYYDLNADGKNEIIIRRNQYTPFGSTTVIAIQPSNSFGTLWTLNPAYDPLNAWVEFPFDDGDADSFFDPHDIDGDGNRDVAVVYRDPSSTTATAKLEIRRADTFALVHTFPSELIQTGDASVHTLQLDTDAAYELVFYYGPGVSWGHSAIKVFDGQTKALEWSYAPGDGRTINLSNPGDFNQDGFTDLVITETLDDGTGARNTKIIDARNGFATIYETNPGLLLGRYSILATQLKVDGGFLLQTADAGNDGQLKFLQVDIEGATHTARLIHAGTFAEAWASAPYPAYSFQAYLADVDPSPGVEVILNIIDGGASSFTTTTKVLGCFGPAGTPTPTRTPAPPSATPSRTPTMTRTFTPLPGSPTDSPTQSPSFTPSPSYTASPTVTPSATPSATPTVSPTPSVSPTVSATYTITPTFTPALYDASAGALAKLKPVFNPIRGDVLELYIELGAPAETMDVELYNPAMVLIKRERISLALAGARSRHRVDASGLAGGPFFARVAVQNAKGEAGHRVLRLYRVP